MNVLYFAVEKAAIPISIVLQRTAAQSNLFASLSIATARAFHAQEVRREKRWVMFGPEDEVVVPMTDQRACKLGTEIFGQSIIWIVGLGVLLHQTQSSEEAAADADEKSKSNQQDILGKLEKVTETQKMMTKQLAGLKEQLEALEAVQQHSNKESKQRRWLF